MDLVVPAEELEGATISDSRHKDLLINVTSAARKIAHARPGYVYSNERIFELTTRAVEEFRRLGRNGEELLELVAPCGWGGGRRRKYEERGAH